MFSAGLSKAPLLEPEKGNMALFFPQELTTSVDLTEDDEIRITQYSDDSCDHQVGQVVLSRKQFSEILNREKQIGDE